MSDLQATIDCIEGNLARANDLANRIEQAQAEIERNGMYPAVASEQYQQRPNGQADYLYMVFRTNGEGDYEGPGGKRKLYIGADPEKQAAARRLNVNRMRFDKLTRRRQDVSYWITGQRRTLNNLLTGLNQLAADTADLPSVPELPTNN